MKEEKQTAKSLGDVARKRAKGVKQARAIARSLKEAGDQNLQNKSDPAHNTKVRTRRTSTAKVNEDSGERKWLKDDNKRDLLISSIGSLKGEWLDKAVKALAPVLDEFVNSPAPGRREPSLPLPEHAPALWAERTTGREVSPVDFVVLHYSSWIGNGLSALDIKDLDASLYQAYATWVHRHPDDKLDLAKTPNHRRVEDPIIAIERRRERERLAARKHRESTSQKI